MPDRSSRHKFSNFSAISILSSGTRLRKVGSFGPPLCSGFRLQAHACGYAREAVQYLGAAEGHHQDHCRIGIDSSLFSRHKMPLLRSGDGRGSERLDIP